MKPPVIELDHVTAARPGGPAVFENLSWAIHEGQTWAIVGPVGSGKTTLAELLLGKLHARSGEVRWPLLERLRAASRRVNYPSEVIRHVTFKEESRLFSYSGHYYQQRFEFADEDEPLTLAQFLRSGATASDEDIARTAEQLGITAQLPLAFIKLSNGQTRRARIARALLSRPELLILDDPFLGIDAPGREHLAGLLGDLVARGLRLVLICRPDMIPGWVTDVFKTGAEPAALLLPPRMEGNADPDSSGTAIIELRDVSVRHGGKAILRDITWTVQAGQRWAVLGPNGSGKTTLLSLLCGDHPQAYANDIRLFGRPRGSGESIWDVKRNVGLVSPELHLYFTEPLTAERAAATGFFDTLADQPTTPAQVEAVRELFARFGITHLIGRPFRQLSAGEQRLVLLVRALVKRPPLVILDEPFQSLDDRAVSRVRDWLDGELDPDQTLLFVSHHAEEIPRTVTRRLRLDSGAVVELG